MSDVTFNDWLERQFNIEPRTQAKDIAGASGISPGYLSGLRRANKTNPSADTAKAIAMAFAAVRKLTKDETRALVNEAIAAASISVERTPDPARTGRPVNRSDLTRWERLLEGRR